MIEDLTKTYETPFYCYDQKIIEGKIDFLKSLNLNFNYSLYFSVKANPNLAIINFFKQNNIGATVVSSGELFKAIRAGINPSNIVINGSSKNEFDLKYAITQKINCINIENIQEIDLIESYSKEKNLKTNFGVRINPGIDAQTIDKISTGKTGDKFGIEIEQIDFEKLAKLNYSNLKALSIHIGSQITNYNKLIESYIALIDLANNLKNKGFEIETLNFGGGFSIPEEGYKSLDFKMWAEELNKIMKNNNYKIIFEPGRFLVAESGSLVTKVNYIKKSGSKNIALLDSSFSEYIRPAFYNINPIVEVLKNNSQNKIKYDLAGGVCETSDFFLRDVELPVLEVGEFLIFKNVGAYGSSMSSTYNSRPRPLEILFKNNDHRVIRSKDTLEDLCSNEIM